MMAVAAIAAVWAFTAEPIWAGQSNARYVLLRRVISLPSHDGKTPVVSAATIHVTAVQSDDKQELLGAYRLYLDGTILGIGPGRGDAPHTGPKGAGANTTFFDTFRGTGVVDVVNAAAAKHAAIAVGLQCYHYKGDSNAGVLFEMKLSFVNGSTVTVRSSSKDGQWLSYDATKAFNPKGETGRYGAPQEWAISGLMPYGWKFPGFVPSNSQPSWRPAATRVGLTPGLLQTRAKSTLPLQYIPNVRPVSVQRVDKSRYIIDFGTEMMGGLTLHLPEKSFPANTVFKVILGEELESESAVLYPMRTGNDYLNEWKLSTAPKALGTTFEHHEYMQFRYASIEVKNAGSPAFETLDVSAWVVRYPWSEKDSHFASSNATLDAVWRLCRDTLRTTSLDTATDSNTRERLPYEADSYITGLSRLALQAEYEWPRHSWRHNLNWPTWPTEYRQTAPLIALADYMATGELSLYDEFASALLAQTQQECLDDKNTHLIDFKRCSRQTGGLDGPDGRHETPRDMIDWPEAARDGYEMTETSTVVNAFAVAGLRALAQMAKARGKTNEAATLAARANNIAASVNSQLWDHKSGLYLDGLADHNMKPLDHTAWHASVFAAAFGLVPDDRWPALMAAFRRRGMVGSTYASFYFLQGLYQAPEDHGQLALEMLTSCGEHSWCHMIRQGATATMEAWTPAEKDSLTWSHPWATAPSSAIAGGLMGVRALAAGWGSIEVRPQPGNLLWATIRVPSIRGPVDVAFNQTVGTPNQRPSFRLSLRAAGSVSVRACLPRLGLHHAAIYVDGVKTSGTDDGDFVCVSLKPGQAAKGAELVRGKSSSATVPRETSGGHEKSGSKSRHAASNDTPPPSPPPHLLPSGSNSRHAASNDTPSPPPPPHLLPSGSNSRHAASNDTPSPPPPPHLLPPSADATEPHPAGWRSVPMPMPKQRSQSRGRPDTSLQMDGSNDME